MKFPLSERPFPSFKLSEEQCSEFKQLTTAVRDATLDEMENMRRRDARQLNRKIWKQVKSREDVTVYKQIARDERPGQAQQPADTSTWSLPKMIAVGTIAGTLDDVMYGIVTPDAPSIVVKTSYVHDELVDSAVLHQFEHATADDPYKFVGAKWVVKAHSPSVNVVVRPRDVVFVEATGLHTSSDGDRIGYHVMHSVKIPQCPELRHLSIIRSRFSSSYLYRQLRPGTVEVYMMSYVEPGGTAPESIAIMSTAVSLIGCWKSMWCAQNKKLAWLLERKRASESRSKLVDATAKKGCHLCSKILRAYNSAKQCGLCSAIVCSRCRVARKLSYSNELLELQQTTVEVCKQCMTRATNADAFEIAQEDYVDATIRKTVIEVTPLATTGIAPDLDRLHASTIQVQDKPTTREYSSETSSTVVGSLTDLGNFDHVQSWKDDGNALASAVSEPDSEAVLETIEDWEREHAVGGGEAEGGTEIHFASSRRVYVESDLDFTQSRRVQVPVARERDFAQSRRVYAERDRDLDPQQRLMLQMQSLCLAAEQTYRITKSNGESLREYGVLVD